MKIKIKKLTENAIIPRYQSDGAACFDFHCQYNTLDTHVLRANSTLIIFTGLAFEVPKGHVMLIYSRSGHGYTNLVRLANCVGVIDSDYRGEVMLKLVNDSRHDFFIRSGDRIAQAMIIPAQQVFFNEVDELSETARGTRGFGSTG